MNFQRGHGGLCWFNIISPPEKNTYVVLTFIGLKTGTLKVGICVETRRPGKGNDFTEAWNQMEDIEGSVVLGRILLHKVAMISPTVGVNNILI